MIKLHSNRLQFQFPEVHEEASCSVSFIRTLRIPDDNRAYPLPPGFQRFPLERVDDYENRVPRSWNRHGGVFMPMYQAEDMWLSFSSTYPTAVKIAAGKINAVTGDPWSVVLGHNTKQDYVVIPAQPWLDGFYAGKGVIRQFVAMPLGEGYTAEEQLTGEAEHGGLQIVAYPMKAAEYERRFKERRSHSFAEEHVTYSATSAPAEMELAPGGLIRQEIYDDEYGFKVWDRSARSIWDQSARSRCCVHILNSLQYCSVTGQRPPTKPPAAVDCSMAGLPWFEYYAQDQKALSGDSKLLGLDSVAAMKIKKGDGVLEGNDAIVAPKVKVIIDSGSRVREGAF